MPRRLRAELFATQAVLNRGTPYSTKGAKAKAFLSECILLLKSLDGTEFIILKISGLTKTIWL